MYSLVFTESYFLIKTNSSSISFGELSFTVVNYDFKILYFWRYHKKYIVCLQLEDTVSLRKFWIPLQGW